MNRLLSVFKIDVYEQTLRLTP